MKRIPVFAGILLLTAFLLLGCGKSREKEMGDKELVRVNDVSISLDEFHQISEGQSLEGKMRLLNEKGLRDFLENYVVTRELLYQEAKKKGLRKEPGDPVEDRELQEDDADRCPDGRAVERERQKSPKVRSSNTTRRIRIALPSPWRSRFVISL